MYAEVGPQRVASRLEKGRRASDALRVKLVDLFLECETLCARLMRRAAFVADEVLIAESNQHEESCVLLLKRALQYAKEKAAKHEARAVALSSGRMVWRRCSEERRTAENRASELAAEAIEADAEFWRWRRRGERSREARLCARALGRARDAAKVRAARACREREVERGREAREVLDVLLETDDGDDLVLDEEAFARSESCKSDADRLVSAALRVLDWDLGQRTNRTDGGGSLQRELVGPDLFEDSVDAWAVASAAQRRSSLAVAGTRRDQPDLSSQQAVTAVENLALVARCDEADAVHRAIGLASTFRDPDGKLLLERPPFKHAVRGRNDTFWDDILLASIRNDLELAFQPLCWDDPRSCSEIKLADAVATVHALLFAKIPAVAHQLKLAADAPPARVRRFVATATDRAQLPYFLAKQILEDMPEQV